MVSNGMIEAKINRMDGIVVFKAGSIGKRSELVD